MSAHASEACSIAHCTDSEDLPNSFMLDILSVCRLLKHHSGADLEEGLKA